MKLEELFERSLQDVSQEDIKKFSSRQKRSDIDKSDIRLDKFKYVIDRIKDKFHNGKLTIYRAIELEPYADINTSLKRRLGIFWTHDIGSARTYRSPHRGYGDEYIIQAVIDEKYIDWDATIALNTIKARGKYENEIRLFKNTPIKVTKIYSSTNGKLEKVDTNKLSRNFIS